MHTAYQSYGSQQTLYIMPLGVDTVTKTSMRVIKLLGYPTRLHTVSVARDTAQRCHWEVGPSFVHQHKCTHSSHNCMPGPPSSGYAQIVTTSKQRAQVRKYRCPCALMSFLACTTTHVDFMVASYALYEGRGLCIHH